MSRSLKENEIRIDLLLEAYVGMLQ
jgi:hypothetical protein